MKSSATLIGTARLGWLGLELELGLALALEEDELELGLAFGLEEDELEPPQPATAAAMAAARISWMRAAGILTDAAV